MTNESKEGSRFVVDLGTIKLPPLQEQRVGAEIQATVLRALAESDFGGDQQARMIPIWDQFPHHTLGLWPRDWVPTWPLPGDPDSLTVRDHTVIMRAIMEHPLEVLRNLPAKHKSKGGRPLGTEVLHAALQVGQIGDDVKRRIGVVLALLPKIEAAQAAAPESLKQALDDLRQKLANKTIEQKCRVLRDPSLRSSYREPGLAEGMEVAAQILEDGKNSIYSPDFSFYKLLQEDQGSSGPTVIYSLGDIADIDGVAAAFGGGAGALVGSPGGPVGSATAAGIGAAVGSAAASAGAALAAFVNWLF